MPRKAFETLLQEKAVSLLFVFNCILLVASWVMSITAYKNLPATVPRLIDFLGRPLLEGNRSPLFFLSPILQTGLFLVCVWGSYRIVRIVRNRKVTKFKGPLLQEAAFLLYIFVQLIFIHVQRAVIYLAHGMDKGFNAIYFYALFVIILALIPYFRLRMKLRE
jgi:uncharacterized membrane protein